MGLIDGKHTILVTGPNDFVWFRTNMSQETTDIMWQQIIRNIPGTQVIDDPHPTYHRPTSIKVRM